MKIITRKKADEILKRITANEIIAFRYINDVDAYTNFVKNNASIAFEIGGFEGANKVLNTAKKYLEAEE